MLKINTIHATDALTGLRQLPDESVDMVITSPPYWNLRDYGKATETIWNAIKGCRHQFGRPLTRRKTGGGPKAQVATHQRGIGHFKNQSRFCLKCGAWKGQLGLEPDFTLYLNHLLSIFDEIKRVLKPTGSCWVNLSDTYGGASIDVSYATRRAGKSSILSSDLSHLPKTGHCRGRWDKCLLGLPERFVLGMLERGWILRNKIIWHKPSHLPISAKDRLANAWEYLFFFTKSKHYYFDLDSIRQPHKRGTPQAERDYQRMMAGRKTFGGKRTAGPVPASFISGHPLGRTPNDVWTIPTSSFPGAHFAVYPEKLLELPIQATCPSQICLKCGKPYPQKPATKKLKYFLSPCKCQKDWTSGLVLDPFMGSGTTAVVAKKLGRRFLGLEMNPAYVKMARQRLRSIKSGMALKGGMNSKPCSK